MAIEVHCTCGNALTVGAELAGKKVRCKACREVLAIPAVPLDASAEEEAPAGSADAYEVVRADEAPRSCPACGAAAAPGDSACLACGAELGGGAGLLDKVPRQVLLGGVALVLLLVLGGVARAVWLSTRPGTHTRAGLAYLGEGDFAAAKREFQEALSYDREHPGALVGLAELGAQSKDAAVLRTFAPRVLERGLIEDPEEEARLRLAYAWLLIEEKKYVKAHNEAVEARGVEGFAGEAEAVVGMAALAGGHEDDAREALRKAVQAGYRDVRVFAELARLERAAGALDAALRAAEQAVALAEDDASLWLLLADLREEKGDASGLAAALEKAVAADPKNATAHARLSRVRLDAGRAEDALSSAREAAKLAPEDPEALTALGRALLAAGRPGEAAPPLERALSKRQHWETEYLYGRALLEQGEERKGLQAVGKALAARPRDVRLRIDAARVALSAGKPEQAASFLREAVEVAPEDYDVRVLLARSLAQQPLGRRKHDEAIRQHLQTAIDANPRRREAPAALARHHLELLQPEAALAAARKGLKYNDADAELRYLEGTACLALRRWDDAIRAFEACQRLDPGYEDVREKLEEAQEGKFYDRN